MNRPLTLKIIGLLIFLPWALSVNAQRLIYSPDIPVQKVRVILEQTQGGTISEMLTDLEYIPLEGSRGNLVDRISSVKVLDDRIGVVTSNDGYFYLYSGKGKFIKKITKIDGFKPKEGNTLFYNVEKEDEGFLLSRGAFSVKIDKDGNILDTATRVYKVNDDFIGRRFSIGKGEYSYISPSYDEKKKTDHALLLGDSVLVRYNLRDTIRTYFSAGNELSKTGIDKEFFAFPNNYKLFELNEDGIQRIYDFVFPFRNTMDTNFYTTVKNTTEYFKYLNEHLDKIYGIGRPVLYKNYLLLYVARWHNPRWIAYNLETSKTLGLDHIIPDHSNDFLDFYDDNHLFSDGDYLYSFIYPQQIRSAKNKSMDERHTMRKEYIDLEKNNNPVLVRFKIK